jgi:hypothetical protein
VQEAERQPTMVNLRDGPEIEVRERLYRFSGWLRCFTKPTAYSRSEL